MANKRQSSTGTPITATNALIAEAQSDLPIATISEGEGTDILRACCSGFLAHHQRYVESSISALQSALAAGKFSVLIKETVGHGHFRAFCEREFPHVRFRRIEQFKKLAEREDELLEILRSQHAQHAAHLNNEELLAQVSVRKAQRLLSGELSEGGAKRQAKKRRKTADISVDQIRDELLTPLAIVEAAENLLGSIQLDPAAGENPHLHHVPRRLRPADDGLSLATSWNGRVFLHPPFSQTEKWVHRLKAAVSAGDVQEAVLLIPTLTDRVWFLGLSVYAKAFLHQPPQFAVPERASPFVSDIPYVVVHLACGEQRLADFTEAFGKLADIYVPLRRSCNAPVVSEPPFHEELRHES